MKKIFYTALPYILFALVAVLVFGFFFGVAYGLCVLVCLAMGKSFTLGLLVFALWVGTFAATVFIMEEG